MSAFVVRFHPPDIYQQEIPYEMENLVFAVMLLVGVYCK